MTITITLGDISATHVAFAFGIVGLVCFLALSWLMLQHKRTGLDRYDNMGTWAAVGICVAYAAMMIALAVAL